jgi:hypothetical protein
MSVEPSLAAGAERVSAPRALAAAFGLTLLAWLLPRRAARAAVDLPLWAMWLAHLLVGGISALLVVLFEGPGVQGWSDASHRLIRLARDSEMRLTALAALAAIEAAFLFLALILLPWAAHDEPLKQTWRHAQRVAWLVTGCAVPATCLIEFVQLAETYPRLRELLYVLCMEGLAVWVLFVAFRAAAIPRPGPPVERPPVCEECGYNLSYTPTDSRCPECGTPVCESFSPGRRTPTPWEAQESSRTTAAFISCSFEAILRPRRFFRVMEARRGLPQAREFLLVQTVLTGLVAFGSPYWAGLWVGGSTRDIRSDLVLITTILALYVGVFVIGWTNLLAVVLGLCCRWAWKQNALPAIAKALCYTSVFAPVVACVCGLASGPTVYLLDTASRNRWVIGNVQAGMLIGLAWFALLVVGLLLHLLRSIAAIRQVRYANT